MAWDRMDSISRKEFDYLRKRARETFMDTTFMPGTVIISSHDHAGRIEIRVIENAPEDQE